MVYFWMYVKVIPVIFPQETWLLRHDMHFFPSIECEFYGDGISSIDTTEGILLGRP